MRALPAILALLALLAGCVEPDANAPPGHSQIPTDPATPSANPTLTPYAGQESREIKALSPEDVDGYRRGAGLGYAKPAELNSYPGPLHALDMRARLQLTDEQAGALTREREEMLATVIPLGERFLASEAEIEQRFRDGTMTPDALDTLIQESARIEAQIRYAHLDAHIATKEILTPHQVALYDEARGYGDAEHDAHGHG